MSLPAGVFHEASNFIKQVSVTPSRVRLPYGANESLRAVLTDRSLFTEKMTFLRSVPLDVSKGLLFLENHWFRKRRNRVFIKDSFTLYPKSTVLTVFFDLRIPFSSFHTPIPFW